LVALVLQWLSYGVVTGSSPDHVMQIMHGCYILTCHHHVRPGPAKHANYNLKAG